MNNPNLKVTPSTASFYPPNYSHANKENIHSYQSQTSMQGLPNSAGIQKTQQNSITIDDDDDELEFVDTQFNETVVGDGFLPVEQTPATPQTQITLTGNVTQSSNKP